MSYLPDRPAFLSIVNSTATTLGSLATFSGSYESAIDYSVISVNIGAGLPAGCSGSLYFDLSQDGLIADRTVEIPVDDISNASPGIHTLIPIAKYFRVRYANGLTAQTRFRLQTIYHKYLSKLPTSRVNQTISKYADVENVRAILSAQDPNGTVRSINATNFGHLETAIHDPAAGYGEVLMAAASPLIAVRFPYQTSVSSSASRLAVSGSATWTVNSGSLQTSLGTTNSSSVYFTSKRMLQCTPGMSNAMRFEQVFGTPVPQSVQWSGIGCACEGVFFGYSGSNFGILQREFGRFPIYAYTVTAASTTATNITVTLNGTAISVPVTNNASTIKTANEIAAGAYSSAGIGWSSWTSGSVVYFAGEKAVPTTPGSFSIVGGTVDGTFATYHGGGAPTETFTSQSNWSHDTMDGSNSLFNPSGLLLQPTLFNSYQIYLCPNGTAKLLVQKPSGSGVDSATEYNLVHIMQVGGNATHNVIENFSQPFRSELQSLGSTTDITSSLFQIGGVLLGKRRNLGPKRAYSVAKTGVASSGFVPLLSIRNPRSKIVASDTSKSLKSNSELTLLRISIANGTPGAEIRLMAGGALSNDANWFDVDNATTLAQIDTSATALSGGRMVWSAAVGANTDLREELEGNYQDFYISPGDSQTIVAKAASSTSEITVALTWIELGT